MHINDIINNRLIIEGIINGVYFFKDTGKKKTKASDRIITIYDGSQFVSDTGRYYDEIYEISSITILFNGKRTTLTCNDISSDSGRIKVCVRYGTNNYDWKYL